MTFLLGRLQVEHREEGLHQQLEQLNTFRVLCAHRRGPTGVERVNRDIEQLLERHGWLSRGRLFYDKRPIIITENDDAVGVGVDSVEVKIRRTLAVGGALFARLDVEVTAP